MISLLFLQIRNFREKIRKINLTVPKKYLLPLSSRKFVKFTLINCPDLLTR